MSLGKAVKTTLISAAACTAAAAIAATSVFIAGKFCSSPREPIALTDSTVVAIVECTHGEDRVEIWGVPPTTEKYRAAFSWCCHCLKTCSGARHHDNSDFRKRVEGKILCPVFANGSFGQGIVCSFNADSFSYLGWSPRCVSDVARNVPIYFFRDDGFNGPGALNKRQFHINPLFFRRKCVDESVFRLSEGGTCIKDIVERVYGSDTSNTLNPADVKVSLYTL